jgi:hypothetical protein
MTEAQGAGVRVVVLVLPIVIAIEVTKFGDISGPRSLSFV